MNASMSQANERAELNWAKYRELKKHRAEWTTAVRPVECALQAEIRTSVYALASVLIIQINEGEENCEEVPDLWSASLAAIRPQLVGAIAEAADRELAAPRAEEGV